MVHPACLVSHHDSAGACYHDPVGSSLGHSHLPSAKGAQRLNSVDRLSGHCCRNTTLGSGTLIWSWGGRCPASTSSLKDSTWTIKEEENKNLSSSAGAAEKKSTEIVKIKITMPIY